MNLLRLFTDGGARGNPGPAGIGMLIEDESGSRLWESSDYLGKATNNQAEYRALIAGLTKAREWAPKRLEVYLDSELVVRQMQGLYKIKNPDLNELAKVAKELMSSFSEVQLTHIPRAQNQAADRLANQAMDRGQEGCLPVHPLGLPH